MLIATLGRICVSIIFILAGLQKIIDWQGTETYFVNALLELLNFCQDFPKIQEFIRLFTPYTTELLIAGMLVELLGGALLFLGLQVRLSATLLALFLIPTTLIFHEFWFLSGPERELQMAMFLKNLAIFGGLLNIAVFGKGKLAARKKGGSEK